MMTGHAVSEERHLSQAYREQCHVKPQQRRESYRECGDLQVATEGYQFEHARSRSGGLGVGIGRVESSAGKLKSRSPSTPTSIDEEERERMVRSQQRRKSTSFTEEHTLLSTTELAQLSPSSGHRQGIHDNKRSSHRSRSTTRGDDTGSGRAILACDPEQYESSRQPETVKRVPRNRSKSVIEIGDDLDRVGMLRENNMPVKHARPDFGRARSSESSDHQSLHDADATHQHKAIRKTMSDAAMAGESIDKTPSDKPERAVKYTFNHETEEWEGQRVYISLSERPFAQGGCRVCYKMNELHPDGAKSSSVAKMYKIPTSPETYFDEAMTQMLAEDYAKEFNRLGLKRSIGFLPVSVLKLSERGGQLVNVEPVLAGKYVKHNDNDGHVDTDDMVPQAFSHFSWEKSKRKLLICDIQGVEDYYTDPQIHSEDGEGFGTGNMGMEGVTRFFDTHKCNLICKALQLTNCKFTAASSAAGTDAAFRRLSSSDSNLSAGLSPKRLASASAFERRSSAASGGADSATSNEESGWSMSASMSSEARAARKDGGKEKSKFKARLWNTGRNYGKALLKAVKATLAVAPTSPEARAAPPPPLSSVAGADRSPDRYAQPRARRQSMSSDAEGSQSRSCSPTAVAGSRPAMPPGLPVPAGASPQRKAFASGSSPALVAQPEGSRARAALAAAGGSSPEMVRGPFKLRRDPSGHDAIPEARPVDDRGDLGDRDADRGRERVPAARARRKSVC